MKKIYLLNFLFFFTLFSFIFVLSLISDVTVSEVVPFTLTERTEYDVAENTVYIEITDLVGKDQSVNITNIFKKHSLTEQITYTNVLVNQSRTVNDYGYIDVLKGKYKDNITKYTVVNETEKIYRSYYVHSNGTLLCEAVYAPIEMLLGCDHITSDKSVWTKERGIVGTHEEFGYSSLPSIKGKFTIGNKKIEQKQEGIPLPKDGSVQLKFVVKHPLVYDLTVPYEVNKYNITACSKEGCIEIDPTWQRDEWGYSMNLTITEPGIIGRNVTTGLPHEPIDVHFVPTTSTAITNCTKEIRVVNETNGTVDSQIWNETYSGGKCTECNIVFLINLTKSQEREYTVYYGSSTSDEPSYANRTNFNEYNGNFNNGILSIDGHKRFQMSNGAIRENYGDTDTYSSGLEFETQNVYNWGHEWNDLDNKGTYRIGNDSTGVIDGPIKTTINITNETKFGTATGINYLIDIYAGRQVAFYRFADNCKNSATDTGCGDWAGAAERNEDCIGYVQAIDNAPPDAILYRSSTGTVASETGGPGYFANYGFISGDAGTTDIRVLGWQDIGGATQTDAVGYGDAGNHRPKYRQFSDTWSVADSDGNFSNMTVFYHEINQNTGTKLNDSYMAYTNPATYSWGTEETAPPPPVPSENHTSVNLLLNGTDGNLQYRNGTWANFTVVLNDSGNVNLTTNISSAYGWSNQTNKASPYMNYTLIMCSSNTTYNITGIWEGNATSQGSNETHFIISCYGDDFYRYNYETITNIDKQARSWTSTRSQSETHIMSEYLSRPTTIIRSSSETLTNIISYLRTPSWIRPVSETLTHTVSDVRSVISGRANFETLAHTIATFRAVVFIRSLSNTVTHGIATSRTASTLRYSFDSFTSIDSYSKLYVGIRDSYETLTHTVSDVRSVISGRANFETLTNVLLDVRSVISGRANFETLAHTIATSRTIAILRASSETLTHTLSVSRLTALLRGVYRTLTLTISVGEVGVPSGGIVVHVDVKTITGNVPMKNIKVYLLRAGDSWWKETDDNGDAFFRSATYNLTTSIYTVELRELPTYINIPESQSASYFAGNRTVLEFTLKQKPTPPVPIPAPWWWFLTAYWMPIVTITGVTGLSSYIAYEGYKYSIFAKINKKKDRKKEKFVFDRLFKLLKG